MSSKDIPRSICWIPTWNDARKDIGLEHLVLRERSADSVILAFDEGGRPFRLIYRLAWDDSWQLREAECTAADERGSRTLALRVDGRGRWYGGEGRAIDDLDGCGDIDIWPTPFTNSFPIRRHPLAIGERREFLVAWVSAPELTLRPMKQAYTRLADRLYLFEQLDGSGFRAELPVDGDGVVVDYPGLFRRIGIAGGADE